MDRSVITDAWPRQVTAGVRDQYLGRDRGALAARVDGAGWPDRAHNSVVGPTLLLAPLSLTATSGRRLLSIVVVGPALSLPDAS